MKPPQPVGLPVTFSHGGGPLAGRPWDNTLILQGCIVACLAVAIIVAVIISVYPDALAQTRRRYGFSRQALIDVSKALAVCTVFMLVGPALMVLNKEIMQTLEFDFPLTLSCLGLLTTAVLVRSLVACGVCEVRLETHEAVAGKAWYYAVLPIALAKAVTLACGNAVYLHLGIGFIQMLKALNPVIVVIVMRACGLELPGRVARWGVYLIISGTLVEVKGELNATVIGIVLMMTSEVMEAINLVLTQKMLQNCKFSLIESIYMIAPPSGMILLSAAAVVEWPRMLHEGKVAIVGDHLAHFVASCFLGLTVNFVGMSVIQATSSLTLKVLNIIRGIGVVFVGVLFYDESCTLLEVCGYATALAGFSLYTFSHVAERLPDKDKVES